MEISYLNTAYIKCTGFKCIAQWNVTKWTHPFKQLTAQNIKITSSPLTCLSVTASSFLSGNKQYSDFNHYRLIFPLHELLYMELNSKYLLFFLYLAFANCACYVFIRSASSYFALWYLIVLIYHQFVIFCNVCRDLSYFQLKFILNNAAKNTLVDLFLGYLYTFLLVYSYQ